MKRLPFSVTLLGGLESSGLFLLFLLGMIVFLIAWSSSAQINQVIRVEGKIIPTGRSQQVQHLEGGIVAAIHTREGAKVKRGDLLISIDQTAMVANLSEMRIRLQSQRVRAVRLQAESKGLSSLHFPPDLAATAMADAENSLFLARRSKQEEEISVHEEAIHQRSAEIAIADQKRTRLSTEKETAGQRLNILENMSSKGVASQIEVLEAQSRDQRLKTEMGETEGAIPRAKAAIAEEHARIAAVTAEFRAQASNDLVSTLAEIQRLQQSLTTDTDRVKRSEIRAPIDGTVNRINVNTLGAVVKSGETLIELTPQTDGVVIEARANPRDRGYLHPGQTAEIRISAFDASELGLLRGKVTEVGSDSIADGHNEPYYQVNILVNSIPPSYKGRDFVPGMTVTADIVAGERTVLFYLLSPLHKFTYAILRDPR